MRRLALVAAAFAISGVALAAAQVLRPSEPDPVQPIQLRVPTDSAPTTATNPRSKAKPDSKPERRERASEQTAPAKRPARSSNTTPPRSSGVRPDPVTPAPGAGEDAGQEDEPAGSDTRHEDEPPGTESGPDAVDDAADANDVDDPDDSASAGNDD